MVQDMPERSFEVRITSSGRKMILIKHLNAFELDEVGASVWNSCDGQHTIDQIAEAVASEFEVDIDTVRADVEEFVQDLRDAQLLES